MSEITTFGTIIELLRETFLRLSMTRTEFKLFDPASKDELEALAKIMIY